MRIILFAAVSTLVLVFTGCHSRTRERGVFFPPRDPWTAKLEVYQALDLTLYGTLTYQSLELRRKDVQNAANSFHLSDQEIALRQADQEKQWEQYADFFLSAFTPQRAWNDFHLPESHWRIYLVAPEADQLSPVKIDPNVPAPDRRGREGAAWNRSYLIRFARPAGADGPVSDATLMKRYRVVITGPLGETTLSW